MRWPRDLRDSQLKRLGGNSRRKSQHRQIHSSKMLRLRNEAMLKRLRFLKMSLSLRCRRKNQSQRRRKRQLRSVFWIHLLLLLRVAMKKNHLSRDQPELRRRHHQWCRRKIQLKQAKQQVLSHHQACHQGHLAFSRRNQSLDSRSQSRFKAEGLPDLKHLLRNQAPHASKRQSHSRKVNQSLRSPKKIKLLILWNRERTANKLQDLVFLDLKLSLNLKSPLNSTTWCKKKRMEVRKRKGRRRRRRRRNLSLRKKKATASFLWLRTSYKRERRSANSLTAVDWFVLWFAKPRTSKLWLHSRESFDPINFTKALAAVDGL